MNAEKIVQPKAKGKVQVGIGIVACVLLLLTTAGQIFSVYVDHSMIRNEELLITLGYDPSDFHRPLGYWVARYSFHTYGLISLLLYLIFILRKKLPVVIVSFCLCLAYFSISAFINITSLSTEEQIRGLTIGGWIGKVISWLPRYGIELALLVQGLLGVRKLQRYHKLNTNEISDMK